MITLAIVAGIVLVGLVLGKLIERAKGHRVVATLHPVEAAFAKLDRPVASGLETITDDAIEAEYGQRMKRRAESDQLRKTVEKIRDLYIAQTTPIMSALPPEVKPHPAALLAESPPVPKSP